MKKINVPQIDCSGLVNIGEDIWYLPEYHFFFKTPEPDSSAIRQTIRAHGLVSIREQFEDSIRQKPEIFFGLSRLQSNLRTITVEVTSGCMLGCSHCYQNGSGQLPLDKPYETRNISEMTLIKTLKEIFEKSEQKQITVQFIGGEPLIRMALLRQVIPKVKAMGAKKGIWVSYQVITNGVLLNKSVLKFLDQEDVEILLSLEGPSHIQNLLRPFKDGRPTADIILRNIAGYEQKIAVIFLLCKQTRNLTENVDFFLRRGFKGVSFNYAYTPDPQRALTEEDTSFILKDIDDHWDFYLEHFREIRNFRRIIGSLDVAKAQVISCNAGRNYVALGADGEYYICQRAYGMKDLRLDSLLSPDSPYKAYSVEDFAPCRACWARYVCGGICWFNAWHWPDDYRKIRCRFMQELVKRVAKIWFSQQS